MLWGPALSSPPQEGVDTPEGSEASRGAHEDSLTPFPVRMWPFALNVPLAEGGEGTSPGPGIGRGWKREEVLQKEQPPPL